MTSLSSVLKLQQDIQTLKYATNPTTLLDEEYRIREVAENSFRDFVALAWPSYEGVPFKPGWHIDALADHLQALADLSITRLIVNVPPRTGKSSLCSVLFPAWLWTINPRNRFLCTSYSQSLSVRDSEFTRRLVTSSWYQRLWGHRVQLSQSTNTKIKFDTTAGGYRVSSSVGGTITGWGANYDICFPEGTLVNVEGGFKPIESLQRGDYVWSFCPIQRCMGLQPITRCIVNYTEELVDITFDDGLTITCTPNHPFLTEDGYVAAEELGLSDNCFFARPGSKPYVDNAGI